MMLAALVPEIFCRKLASRLPRVNSTVNSSTTSTFSMPSMRKDGSPSSARLRLNVNATLAAVNGVPSVKVTPSRKLNV